MKRLYVWEWVMVLISLGAYFSSLFCGLANENAVVIASLFILAVTVVALFSIESVIVAMVTFSAIGFAAPYAFKVLPGSTVMGLSVLLSIGAIYTSVICLIDNHEEINYQKFFGSLISEFLIVLLSLKYGYLLWNYWQKF